MKEKTENRLLFYCLRYNRSFYILEGGGFGEGGFTN